MKKVFLTMLFLLCSCHHIKNDEVVFKVSTNSLYVENNKYIETLPYKQEKTVNSIKVSSFFDALYIHNGFKVDYTKKDKLNYAAFFGSEQSINPDYLFTRTCFYMDIYDVNGWKKHTGKKMSDYQILYEAKICTKNILNDNELYAYIMDIYKIIPLFTNYDVSFACSKLVNGQTSCEVER